MADENNFRRPSGGYGTMMAVGIRLLGQIQ
jgi:hypothetical protein